MACAIGVAALATASHADTLFIEDKLTASDGTESDNFGSSVAIFGNTAIVGASADSRLPFISGSAYLFDTTTGTQTAKLTASDGTEGDSFGGSVAISGNTAIVGARFHDENIPFNGLGSRGSAYLFDTTTGTQTAKLTASDGAATDLFGGSVAISGNTAIVGAHLDDDNGNSSGSAYLFDTTTGTQTAKLTASDGAAGDRFGRSVAMFGNTVIVGARQDADNGLFSGSAYLFNTTTGTQIAKLTASDGTEGDIFGSSVAIFGNTAIVGAAGDDDNGERSGSAYLFDTTTGTQIAKLTASDGAASDLFGRSVAIFGNTAIVGAWRDDDNGRDSGSVYLFNTTTGTQIAKLTASDGTEGDIFGSSVAIFGNTAIVGAAGDDDNGERSGSAYVFRSLPVAPVPLPAGGVLLLTALGALGVCARRRRKAAA